MADAPNSRNTGDNISGGNIVSDRNPEPTNLRLYSAMMVMVPLRLVSWDWISPIACMGVVFVSSSELAVLPHPAAAAAAEASLICFSRDKTDSDGPSSQYFRTSASLALRIKTPMAPREVVVVVIVLALAVENVDDAVGGGVKKTGLNIMKHWIEEGKEDSMVVNTITLDRIVAMLDDGLKTAVRFDFIFNMILWSSSHFHFIFTEHQAVVSSLSACPVGTPPRRASLDVIIGSLLLFARSLAGKCES